MNPFNLKGPEFLGLYLFVLAVAAGVAGLLRWYFRYPGDDPGPEAFDLQSYEVAYLAGGGARAVNAVLASLVHRGYLAVSATDRTVTMNKPLPPKAIPVEQSVYESVEAHKAIPVKDLHAALDTRVADLGDRARELGLLVGPESQGPGRVLPTLLVLAVAVFGGIKMVVGISRNRPVTFLVMLCIGTVVLAFIGFGRRLHRSRRGDRALAQLKARNAALEYAASRGAEQLSADDLALALGLFGMGVLATGVLLDLKTALTPPARTWGSGSGCGSGCGGGGGGCGGGCGGGGCGGCGG